MTQSCSQDDPPTTTTAKGVVAGHAEQAVQAHATTPALEHAWQVAQEAVVAVLGRAVEAVPAHVQGVVLVAQAVQGRVQKPVVRVSISYERHKHTNNCGM